MTVNETTFFRDEHPFEALRRFVLPELIEARSTQRELRIWCGAASSGQEPYSIAMSLLDIPALAGWHTEILATDLSEEMLNKARENAAAAGADVSFVDANLVDLAGVPDRSFDYAACLFSTLGIIRGG